MPVIGEEPDSQLGKLGFVYASNPMQHSVSGTVLLGSGRYGQSIFGSGAFGAARTSDPDPVRARQTMPMTRVIQAPAVDVPVYEQDARGLHA